MTTPPAFVPSAAHRRRLREVWRSAGWPCRDAVEAELLAAGWLVNERDALGRDTVHLTPSGVALLAETLHKNRQTRSAHEDLVSRVACEMQRAGRVVWRGLSLRAWVTSAARTHAPGLPDPTHVPTPPFPPTPPNPNGPQHPPSGAAAAMPTPPGPDEQPTLPWSPTASPPMPPAPLHPPSVAGAPQNTGPGRWAMAMPDVFSIRHTTVEHYLAPVAHEIKVNRADLLSDLRHPVKGEAYLWLAGECWYVIREGIARPEEIPQGYGVMLAPPTGPLQVARPAPRTARPLPFAVWMALARATPMAHDGDDQAPLANMGDGDMTAR